MAAWDIEVSSVGSGPPDARTAAAATPAYTVSRMAAQSGHSVLTVADVLALDLLRNADVSVAAAGHRLANRVEWVHVFETPAVTGMLRGGEFLLTTGIALATMAPAEVDALVAGGARAGVVAWGGGWGGPGGAECGRGPRPFSPHPRPPPCRSHDLPLLVFG